MWYFFRLFFSLILVVAVKQFGGLDDMADTLGNESNLRLFLKSDDINMQPKVTCDDISKQCYHGYSPRTQTYSPHDVSIV